MSIRDGNGNEIITVNKLQELVFNVAIWMMAIGMPVLGASMVWQRDTIRDHELRIGWLERSTHGTKGGISQSVNVGEASKDKESGREYLTVQEVAEKEQKDERTILLWIEGGRIDPTPIKQGKSWSISADYRILPQVSATFRNEEE